MNKPKYLLYYTFLFFTDPSALVYKKILIITFREKNRFYLNASLILLS